LKLNELQLRNEGFLFAMSHVRAAFMIPGRRPVYDYHPNMKVFRDLKYDAIAARVKDYALE
jgi:hypothetical protein